jgi:hypothetical protein
MWRRRSLTVCSVLFLIALTASFNLPNLTPSFDAFQDRQERQRNSRLPRQSSYDQLKASRQPLPLLRPSQALHDLHHLHHLVALPHRVHHRHPPRMVMGLDSQKIIKRQALCVLPVVLHPSHPLLITLVNILLLPWQKYNSIANIPLKLMMWDFSSPLPLLSGAHACDPQKPGCSTSTQRVRI